MSDIIVVGNGEGILEKKNGKKIDKFNTVVRLGRYVTDGFEDYAGSKTDIISTIYWKLDLDRLKRYKTILSVPLTMQESFLASEDYVKKEYSKYKKNILYLNKEQDVYELQDEFSKLISNYKDIKKVNFSLGFKTLYFLKKLFPESKIYTTGFDFFKTGWYWDPSHNRGSANLHPYTWERLWYIKAKKLEWIYEL